MGQSRVLFPAVSLVFRTVPDTYQCSLGVWMNKSVYIMQYSFSIYSTKIWKQFNFLVKEHDSDEIPIIENFA